MVRAVSTCSIAFPIFTASDCAHVPLLGDHRQDVLELPKVRRHRGHANIGPFVLEESGAGQPAVVLRAHQVLHRDPGVREVLLAEHHSAGHVANRVDLHAGGVVEIHHQHAQPLAALLFRIGPAQKDHPVGVHPVAGPDLAPVDDILVAVTDRRGAQMGQIRAELRLGEALAPHFLHPGDLDQMPCPSAPHCRR